MFKIYDGRSTFFQWDIDRKLIVNDRSITQVHFCNRTDDCALVCKAYELKGLWVVNVPNVILQDDWRIRVYAYDGQATLHEARFNVVARSKPEDYVYTEEELKSWEELSNRIDQIEENGVSDETIANAVESYLDENGIQIDLSDYYTKAETDDAIEQAVATIPEPDLSEYAKKTDIPSTSGLATENYVDEAIAGIKIPEVDLTDYATKKYVGEEIAKAQLSGGDVDLSDYYTKSETDAAIKKAVDEIDIPESADLSNYYNKQEVDAKIPDTSGFALKSEIPSLEGYAKTSDIPDVSKFITEVPAEYITETELNEALANIPTGGGGEGGSVAVDGVTIVENADGTISASVGGGKVIASVGETFHNYSNATGFTAQSSGSGRFVMPNYPESWRFNSYKTINHEYEIHIRNADSSVVDVLTGYMVYCDNYKQELHGNNKFASGSITLYQYNPMEGKFDCDNYDVYQNYYITKVVFKVPDTYEYNKIDSNYINIGDGLNVTASGELSVSGLANLTANAQYNTILQKTNYMANTSGSGTDGAAFGYENSLGGQGSMALGRSNKQYLDYAMQVSVGDGNTNNTYNTFAFGEKNSVAKSNSCAVGTENKITSATGSGYRHAFGYNNTVKVQYGFAAGNGLTVGSNSQMVYGCYNLEDAANTYNVIIGNSTTSSSKANGLTIDKSGNVAVQGTVSNGGADYAEYFEWVDGNPEAEDRVGLMVALDGNKIRLAQAEDYDNILGIVSGTATVLGDDAEWAWQGKYLHDEFGRLIMEEVETFHEETIYNENGTEVLGVETVSDGFTLIPKINPAYDESQPYVSRAKRAEWDAIGMMGKLFVRDDGTCVVNGYAAPAANGVATSATGKTNMRVMERISENIIRVCMK